MITPEQLHKKKADIIASKHRFIGELSTDSLSATTVIRRLQTSNSDLIDYCMMLEQYIGEHENTWEGDNK